MVVIIGISGTHCTGKTTTSKKLKKCLEDKKYKVALISELVRECPHPANLKGSYETQQWQFDELIKCLKKLKAKNYDYIITDRTFLDPPAYFFYTHGYNQQTHSYYVKCVEKQFTFYDYVFYTTEKYDLIDDGFRSMNEHFRSKVDRIMLKLFKDSGSSCIKIKNEKDIIKHLEV